MCHESCLMYGETCTAVTDLHLKPFQDGLTRAAHLPFSVGSQRVCRALTPGLGQPYSTLRGHPLTSCGNFPQHGHVTSGEKVGRIRLARQRLQPDGT